MATASNRDALLRLLTPVVSGTGLDLEDVQVTPAGKRRLLRVVVDQDGGVELDGVASVSTAVSAALDASDVMGGAPYVLEVTSPGVDRPLTEPRHWRRARSRLVEARLADETAVTGRLVEADDQGVLLDVDGAQRRIPWPELATGRVQVEFNRPTPADEDEGE
ncbi:MAG: ribosome maturation factor RimP [Actinomycetota bacterium]|jgi:ribosome maturation factor RimP|nr:ribosome maturation factor RimP [Actinomycetota bacterium]